MSECVVNVLSPADIFSTSAVSPNLYASRHKGKGSAELTHPSSCAGCKGILGMPFPHPRTSILLLCTIAHSLCCYVYVNNAAQITVNVYTYGYSPFLCCVRIVPLCSSRDHVTGRSFLMWLDCPVNTFTLSMFKLISGAS